MSDDRRLAHRRRLAVATYVATLVFWAVASLLERLNPPTGQALTESLSVAVGLFGFATVGAMIAVRRPEHRVGWLFLGIGLLAFSGSAAMRYAEYGLITRPGSVPFAHVAAWYQSWFWFALFAAIALAILHFPDGRPPSPRWRVVTWSMVGVLSVFVVVVAIAPEFVIGQNEWGLRADNPYGMGAGLLIERVEPALVTVMGPAFLAAFASIILRYRRARGRERDQLRWVTFGAVVFLAGLWLVDETALPPLIADVLSSMLFLAIPVTAGMAIVRHRLFDIDRVISRTVAYALLTAFLAGVYVAGVVGLGGLLSSLGIGGGDLVVAASTLAVAALFQPVRRQVQVVVDRRFNRQRYDSEQVVGAFVQRLRDEVEIEALTADVRDVLTAAVHPSFVALWIPPEQAR